MPKTPRQKWIQMRASWERSRHIVVPPRVAAEPPSDPAGLRIAFLVYRGNPRCGGQGVYTRYLSRELRVLGHSVTVFSGPPVAGARRGRRVHAGAEPRPVPPARPLPGAPSARVHVAPRRRGVRCHVQRPGSGEPLASRGGCAKQLAREPRRVRRGPRQPVPGHRHARDHGRRGAPAGDAATTRSPSTGVALTSTRPNPWRRCHHAAVVRVPGHAEAGGPPASPRS